MASYLLGVDEAGKGPVLGPMVVTALAAPSDECLPDEIADSKRLTPTKRDRLATELRSLDEVTLSTTHIHPDRIDDPDTDMNTLTVCGHAEALDPIVSDSDTVILDAGDTNEARFGRRVVDHLDVDIDVIAEHGADDSYPIVEAASIIAKVERDSFIEALDDEYPEYETIGSGYPSDQRTRSFLTQYTGDTGELPECARASWKTSKDILADVTDSGAGD